MKRTALPTLVVLILWLQPAIPASAQFCLIPKFGGCASDLSNTKKIFSKGMNGYTSGLTGELIAPKTGLGFDVSLMYAQKFFSLPRSGNASFSSKRLEYLEVPVNLKWRFGLPSYRFFLTTGPNFSFLVNSNLSRSVKKEVFNFGWNLGAGTELFDFQMAVSYTWGITPAIDLGNVPVKNQGWTITIAYLFQIQRFPLQE